jgi:hypothetical protein
MLRGRNIAVANVTFRHGNVAAMGLRRCTFAATTPGPAPSASSIVLRPHSAAANGPLRHPAGASLVPGSAEAGGNVAATSCRGRATLEERAATFSSTSKAHAPAMEPSSDTGTDPVLGEGHYTVVLAGAGHRTLEVARAGPDFRAGPFIVSYLCGPDNGRDYRAFAHITAAGDGLWPIRTPAEWYGHFIRTARRATIRSGTRAEMAARGGPLTRNLGRQPPAQAGAAVIRPGWAEPTRPRRKERVAGVHPAG